MQALTRNTSGVNEGQGHYSEYHGGAHAAMVLDPEVDMRMFPSQWGHGFAEEEAAPEGSIKRSLQVLDAAGDAVHKVHLKADSNHAGFATSVSYTHLDVYKRQVLRSAVFSTFSEVVE